MSKADFWLYAEKKLILFHNWWRHEPVVKLPKSIISMIYVCRSCNCQSLFTTVETAVSIQGTDNTITFVSTVLIQYSDFFLFWVASKANNKIMVSNFSCVYKLNYSWLCSALFSMALSFSVTTISFSMPALIVLLAEKITNSTSLLSRIKNSC